MDGKELMSQIMPHRSQNFTLSHRAWKRETKCPNACESPIQIEMIEVHDI